MDIEKLKFLIACYYELYVLEQVLNAAAVLREAAANEGDQALFVERLPDGEGTELILTLDDWDFNFDKVDPDFTVQAQEYEAVATALDAIAYVVGAPIAVMQEILGSWPASGSLTAQVLDVVRLFIGDDPSNAGQWLCTVHETFVPSDEELAVPDQWDNKAELLLIAGASGNAG